MPITTAETGLTMCPSLMSTVSLMELEGDLIPEDQLPAIMEHLVFCRQLGELHSSSNAPDAWGPTPNTGQEMPSLAAALAIDKADWLVTCYRENTGLFGMVFPQSASCCTGWAMNAATTFPLESTPPPSPFPLAPKCCTRPVWLGRRKPRKPSNRGPVLWRCH